MTTTAPSPEALAAAPKAIVISQFDVLLGDIAEAKAKAADVTFDYNTKEGNKAARSYIFDKRRLNARIESARTDAKAYALAYGRTVDSQAAELKGEVAALIKPHQEAIDAIAKAEADRVQRHRVKIHFITDLGRVPFGASADALAITLESAKAADIDGLEEFKEEAATALLETIRTLEAAHTKALADEAAAAELEQLREQQRIQREKDAEAKRIKDAEDAAAEVARKAQEEADAAALLVIEEAEQRVADAEARAAAAEARAADAEDVVDLLQSEALLAIKPADVPVAVDEVVSIDTPSHRPIYRAAIDTSTAESNYEAKRRLRMSLNVALVGKSRNQVTEALVAGTLHPAITVDWSRV
jgi:hypothetical protein